MVLLNNPAKLMKPKFHFLLHPSYFFLLICLLPACSSTHPRPVASYSSYLNDSQVTARQMVPMSNEEAEKQRPGSTQSRQTASSETVIKKGKIKKQTSTTEEVIESDTSTVADSFSVPTSDQDAR